jgi:glycosyltransferase involved in cell wall biosynthesis
MSSITFIIPSINRDTLTNSVNSLLKQTNKNWKCIIVFDGVEGIKFDDDRIKTINVNKLGKKGQGHGNAGLVRNEGIKICETEWIGFLDDDLLITRDSINKSLQLAAGLEAKIFQLSVDKNSDCAYNILYQNSSLMFSETNFVEVMAPFIHTSILPTVQKFWDKYDINTGWGFDSILCNIVGEKALVIHNHNMIHPKKSVSEYNKAGAFAEQQTAIYQIYPQFMKEEYGIADAQIPSPQILRRWTKS